MTDRQLETWIIRATMAFAAVVIMSNFILVAITFKDYREADKILADAKATKGEIEASLKRQKANEDAAAEDAKKAAGWRTEAEKWAREWKTKARSR